VTIVGRYRETTLPRGQPEEYSFQGSPCSGASILPFQASLKNIHFKETYALVQAFFHFRPYPLNTTQTVVVFANVPGLSLKPTETDHRLDKETKL
jgi:hypothetical protein